MMDEFFKELLNLDMAVKGFDGEQDYFQLHCRPTKDNIDMVLGMAHKYCGDLANKVFTTLWNTTGDDNLWLASKTLHNILMERVYNDLALPDIGVFHFPMDPDSNITLVDASKIGATMIIGFPENYFFVNFNSRVFGGLAMEGEQEVIFTHRPELRKLLRRFLWKGDSLDYSRLPKGVMFDGARFAHFLTRQAQVSELTPIEDIIGVKECGHDPDEFLVLTTHIPGSQDNRIDLYMDPDIVALLNMKRRVASKFRDKK